MEGLSLGAPSLVGQAGVELVLEAPLPAGEIDSLHHSAGVLKSALEQLDW